MKNIFLSIVLTILGGSAAQAQNLFDKIDNVVDQANRAANSTEKAAKTGGGILSMFNKRIRLRPLVTRQIF